MIDDFNYPTAQRGDTMTLQSIEQGGAALKRRPRDKYAALSTSDIPGAQASSTGPCRASRFINKPNLFDNRDVERSSPTRLIPTVVHKDNTLNLSNTDIEGSQPQRHGFRTDRVTDPNNPWYTLPSYDVAPMPVTKQLAQTNQVDDIGGARPKQLNKGKENDFYFVDDISGAKAGTTRHIRKIKEGKDHPLENPTHEFNHMEIFHTSRHTNPLEPRYDIDVPPGLPAEELDALSHIIGSQPRRVREPRQTETNLLSLRTNDVPGAQSSKKILGPDDRRQFRNPVDISDIPDAQPTLLHAAFHYKRTQRCVDPMNPAYPELKWKTETHPGARSLDHWSASLTNGSTLDSIGAQPRRPARPVPPLTYSAGNSNDRASRAPSVTIPSVMSLPSVYV